MPAENADTDRDEPTEDQYQPAEDVEGDVPQEPVASDPSTWEGDRPPEGAVASADDFRVKRDSHGDLLPVWEPVPGTQREKWVHVRPARQGDADQYLPTSGNPDDMSDAEIVEVLNRFFEEPDFELDPNRDPSAQIEDFLAFGVEPLLLAWYNASGFDVAMGMVGEHSELVEAVEGNTKTGN